MSVFVFPHGCTLTESYARGRVTLIFDVTGTEGALLNVALGVVTGTYEGEVEEWSETEQYVRFDFPTGASVECTDYGDGEGSVIFEVGIEDLELVESLGEVTAVFGAEELP